METRLRPPSALCKFRTSTRCFAKYSTARGQNSHSHINVVDILLSKHLQLPPLPTIKTRTDSLQLHHAFHSQASPPRFQAFVLKLRIAHASNSPSCSGSLIMMTTAFKSRPNAARVRDKYWFQIGYMYVGVRRSDTAKQSPKHPLSLTST